MHQHTADAMRLFRRDGVQRVDRELEAVGRELLDQEDQCRDQNGDDADRGGEMVVSTVFAEVLIINEDRERVVAAADQDRRAEVGKRTHEHQQCGGQNGRHAQAHDHAAEPLDALAAHALRSLEQRSVNIAEGAVHVDDDQREEFQRLDKDDAAEAVDRDAPDADRFEELRNEAGIAHQQDPRIGADIRRGHGAEQTEHEENFPSAHRVERIEICKRDAEQQTAHHDAQTDLGAVADGGIVIGFAEEFLEGVHGKVPVDIDSLLQQPADRQNEEDRQNGQQHPCGNAPEISATFPWIHAQPSSAGTALLRMPLMMLFVDSESKRLTFFSLSVRTTLLPGGRMESISDS